jgi:hypothetical protein
MAMRKPEPKGLNSFDARKPLGRDLVTLSTGGSQVGEGDGGSTAPPARAAGRSRARPHEWSASRRMNDVLQLGTSTPVFDDV